MERFMNALIRFLVRRTHLHCTTIYTVLWKLYDGEAQRYAEEIAQARKKSGCYTEQAYNKWYLENEWEKDKAKWDALVNKFEKSEE